MWEDAGTGEKRKGIAKVGYKHEECIRILQVRPFISQGELAEIFGVSQSWMCQVMGSDAFKARLAEAKAEVHGPAVASVAEKLQQLAHASLDKLLTKIEGPAAMPKEETLLKSLELSTRALGYGARDSGQGGGGAQVIINLPGKVVDEGAWASRYTKSPGGVSDAIEVKPGTPDSN